MFLKHKANGKLVEVLGLKDLFNPNHGELVGRYNAGEELQDLEKFPKDELEFLSDGALPRCWTDLSLSGCRVEALSKSKGTRQGRGRVFRWGWGGF